MQSGKRLAKQCSEIALSGNCELFSVRRLSEMPSFFLPETILSELLLLKVLIVSSKRM